MTATAERASPEGPARSAQRPGERHQANFTVARDRDVLDDACVRRAAVRAAERGYYVFPTRPGGKEPRKGLSWPAAATCDPVAAGNAHWLPGENYGIAAKLSGLVILDLDMPKAGYQFPPEWQAEPSIRDGKDVLAALCERAGQPWPATCTVATPAGGWHLYYTAPAGRAIGNRPLGPLIDVRGGGTSNGGYVLGPGSILGGRTYEVTDGQDPAALPGWIADLLDPPAGATRSAPRAGLATPAAGSAYGRLRGLVAFVLEGTPGDRNGRLHWAACRGARLVAAGYYDRDTVERVLVEAALRAGLRGGEIEARRTIASGMRSA